MYLEQTQVTHMATWKVNRDSSVNYGVNSTLQLTESGDI